LPPAVLIDATKKKNEVMRGEVICDPISLLMATNAEINRLYMLYSLYSLLCAAKQGAVIGNEM
jgi:hypothetical protein